MRLNARKKALREQMVALKSQDMNGPSAGLNQKIYDKIFINNDVGKLKV